MGEGLIPVQYGHLQFIFQGHQPVADLLTALRQFGSLSVAAPILGKRTGRVNKGSCLNIRI